MSIETFHPDDAVSVLMSRPGKWTMVIVVRLREERLRFSQLQRAIGAISQKILTTTLRDLERDGFVQRTVYGSIPPRVEYELTDLGRQLLAMADAWMDFAQRHAGAVVAARQRFDTGAQAGAVPIRLV